MTQLPSPRLTWRDDGSPVSSDFGDVYFSAEDGLAETQHVFLHGNHLPHAWAASPHFTIGETGFGTGLNFLCTWALWRETASPSQHLHYVSVEGFPLSRDDLERALEKWPDLAHLSTQLLARYPSPTRGTHLLHLDDNVHLTLLADEALSALTNFTGQIDAWFLDGFSPACNPEMWSPDLFREIARLSRTGTSLATFTVAGIVRRGLTAAGFEVHKTKGHGRKREMLTGRFTATSQPDKNPPWYQLPPPRACNGPIAIVGAGIAGAAAAHALRQYGFNVTVFDAQGIGSGASGNPAGLMMPRLAADHSPDGRFHVAAYLHTERFLSQLNNSDVFQAGGILQLARTEEEAARFSAIARLGHLPHDHINLLAPHQVMQSVEVETKFPALFFPKAGIVYPGKLLEQLLEDGPPHTNKEDPSFYRAEIAGLAQTRNGWILIDKDGSQHGPFMQVIIANGTGITQYPQTAHLPVEPIQGQLSLAPADTLPRFGPAISAGSYIISLPDERTLFGATYTRVRGAEPALPRIDAHHRNIASLASALPALSGPLAILDPVQLDGRVAYRAQVPDRIPFAGPAPDHEAYLHAYDRLRHGDRFADYPPAPCYPGLYLMGGLGARGFSTSLLLADLLAAQISGTPLPLARDLLEAVHPARFIVRALRKNT